MSDFYEVITRPIVTVANEKPKFIGLVQSTGGFNRGPLLAFQTKPYATRSAAEKRCLWFMKLNELKELHTLGGVERTFLYQGDR